MAINPIRWLFLIAALTMLTQVVRGQGGIQWSAYKIADGLPEPSWHTVSFTPQGKLLATRLNAPQASELDGYSVSNFPAPAGCVSRLCTSPGGQRWALVPEGLAEFRNNAWREHPVPAIHAAWHNAKTASGAVLGFLPVKQATVLFLLSEGLFEFQADTPEGARTLAIRTPGQTHIGRFTGLAATWDESLWISGARGVALTPGPVRNIEPGTHWLEFNSPESLALTNFTQPITDGDSIVLVADSIVDGQKRVISFDRQNWVVLPAGVRKFNRAWRGPEHSMWAATDDTLFRWVAARTNWVEYEEMPVGQVFDVATEPGGAFWLATSEGIFRAATPLWSGITTTPELEWPIRCLVNAGEGRLYAADGRKLYQMTAHGSRNSSWTAPGGSSVSMPVLYPLKDGSVLENVNGAVYRCNPADGSSRTLAAASERGPVRILGALPDGTVCLFKSPTLERFDGARIASLANPPPMEADDGQLNTLYTTRDGDLWIGGDHVVLWRHDDKWRRFTRENRPAPEFVIGFAEAESGRIVCATPDQLWSFDGARWSQSPNRFNHIHCLMPGRDGGIWLGSDSGLFRFFEGVWLEYGAKEGLPDGPVTALCEDSDGKVWAALGRSLAVFHPGADTSPPRTRVRWLAGSGHQVSEGDTLNLLFEAHDKWKITAPERLFYSYQMDQHGWSPFQDVAMFSMPSPNPGRHTLQVRAMDRNGNVEPAPAWLDFAVVTPWFRETRLWVILSLGAATAIFFAGIALNRHRQLLRSHAAIEQKVAERTRELEIATRELLHSQKMNALGTLAAGIAHDFNNLLSIIKGSAQIIEDNPDNLEKIRVRVNRIKMVVQQGAEIVDAMLGFGRTAGGTSQPCNVNAVVEDTIRLLGERFLREVEIKFEPAEGLPEVSTARDLVQQILLNFIFNAAESMSERKKIILGTRAAEKLPAEIYLQPGQGGPVVLVFVQDQGGGMTSEIKARIFEPFFTTKALSARRGTGLGLSMVYELAKKLGAGLAVQSAPGEGSTFTLILPVAAKSVSPGNGKKPAETIQL